MKKMLEMRRAKERERQRLYFHGNREEIKYKINKKENNGKTNFICHEQCNAQITKRL